MSLKYVFRYLHAITYEYYKNSETRCYSQFAMVRAY